MPIMYYVNVNFKLCDNESKREQNVKNGPIPETQKILQILVVSKTENHNSKSKTAKKIRF